ncbi:MAG: amino acid adenylation domain-containing protein [Caldilineaceae bacterium]
MIAAPIHSPISQSSISNPPRTRANGEISTIPHLLTRLRALDIHLWLEADRLRYNAPKGVLTSELLDELRANKEEIIAFLQRSNEPSPAAGVKIPRASRTGSLPLSFAQERLWLLDQLEGGNNAAYNMPAAFHLQGALNQAALHASLQELIRRHEILRTTFPAVEGVPVQQIAETANFALPVIDLRRFPGNQQANETKRLMFVEATQPFNLASGPLLRGQLLQLGEEEFVLLLTMHHIISDGWSINVMISELGALYAAFCQDLPSPLAELPVQYADFAQWQRQWLCEKRLENELAFWRERLHGASPLLELPTWQPRPPIQTLRGARLRFTLDRELTHQLRRLSQQQGATLAMTLLSAFNVLLARYSGQNDLVVGMPIANRNHAGIEHLIGFFLNTLLLRSDLSDNPSFVELLVRTRHATVEAYTHQDLPFIKLAEALQPERTLSYNPLFQVLFLYQGEGNRQISLPSLRVTLLENEIVQLKDDLLLELEEVGGTLCGTWEYNLDLFQPAFIERFSTHFEILLRAIVADPSQSVLQLPLLSARERRQLLVDWNNNEAYLDPNLTFLRRFEAQVVQSPNAIAVHFGAEQLSYAALNQRAEELASQLLAQGVVAETIVSVLARRSPDFLASILAIFKVGAAYLPLDLRSPAARIGQVLQQSQSPIVLASRQLTTLFDEAISTLPSNQSPSPIWLEDPAPQLAPIAGTRHNPRPQWAPAAIRNSPLAYVIYTSGSTGTPKGVMVEQRGMINHIFAKIKDLKLTSQDIVAQNASQSFVVSVWQFLAALVVGGSVEIFPDEIANDPHQLFHACQQRGVTILEVVPSLLRTLLSDLAELGAPSLPDLRWLVPTGEVLPPKVARLWLQHYPTIPLLNAYGSTECSDDVAHCPVYVAPGEQVLRMAIGRPVLNTRLYILDGYMQPVPVGVVGEIYVGGLGVGRGYLYDTERTAQAFVADPFSTDPAARLYKTGDKARYLPDGNIEYMGRVDFQVKVRGFRIELGEIESTLAKHPAVAQSLVMAINDTQGNAQLVAYVVHGASEAPATCNLQPATLKSFLAEHLPNYMVPAAVIVLPEFPLNNSGKVDRKALPRPDFEESADTYVAPTNAIEEKLAMIWQEVLSTKRPSVESNFFDLGGHSLLATQVISRIRQQFALELPLRTLFETPTIRGIARHIAQSTTAESIPMPDRPPMVPIARTGDLPLSFAQQRLWFIDQLEGAGSGYVISGVLRLCGSLDQAALHKSLNNVVQRQESLRTTFATVDGQPVQRIADRLTIALPVVDLSHLPSAEQLPYCQELVFADVQQPFALDTGPLLRCTLYQLATDDFVLAVTMHHIISDGWSIGVLCNEMIEHYRQQKTGVAARLPELQIQVADVAQWQRQWLQGEELQQQLNYWKEQLADAPALLELPTDRLRSNTPSFRSDSVPFTLSPALTQQLNQLSAETGSTLFMTLLAAFAVLLARHSAQDDLVIGSPIANRTSHEVEPLIGFFVNTLALRVKLHENPRFVDLLRQVRQTTLDAYAHQEIPFEQVVDALHLPRNLSYTPLFQVMFAWQSASQPALFQNVEGNIAGLEVQALDWKKPSVEFDIVLTLAESTEGVQGSWEFSTDLFDRRTIESMAAHFATLLHEIVARSSAPVATLPILSTDEMATLTLYGTQTGLDSQPMTLHGAFEAQAERTPQATAVLCGEKSLTYAVLNRRANQLAHYLVALGIGTGAKVGIYMERSQEMIVAILGVLKAGAAYLPLDPTYPPERLQFMLEDAAVQLILTQQQFVAEGSTIAPLLNKLDKTQLLALDSAWASLIEQPTSNHTANPSPIAPAYLIYTSGSTGMPKGVVVPHQGAANTVLAIRDALGLQPGDRFLQFAPIGFDVSVMQLFSTLTSGATALLEPTASQLSLLELMRLCTTRSITVLDLPVALWHQSVHELHSIGHRLPASLRAYLTGGEKPSPETLLVWAKLATQRTIFLCSYGPTEASITTTIFVTDSETVRLQPPTHIPLGQPLPNTYLCILDLHQQPVPIGTPGELYIGGIGLALGYHHQPELTAERFVEMRPHPSPPLLTEGMNVGFTTSVALPETVPSPSRGGDGWGCLYRTGDRVRQLADGSVEFLGRVDSQVKVRGFRIELGEIESRLKEHPQVNEAVVAICEPTPNDKRVVAYFQPKEEDLTPALLRDFLKHKLPAYMLPNSYVAITTWPFTPNGKLDRKALPTPDVSLEAEFVAPRNPTEEAVATIWATILGVERVGVESNFFDLGGHSLLATQIVSRIRQHFAIDLPLRSLMEEPTVAAVARQLRQIDETLARLQPEIDSVALAAADNEKIEVFEL